MHNPPSDYPAAFRAIDPVRPPAAWLGGKRRLAKRLAALIEAVPHRVYVEPFVGMGGVFFRRRSAPEIEVINDLSRDVHTFFRVLQRHYVPFMEMMRFQLSVRREFERLVRTDPDTLTDLERAARFFYLQRLAFGGKATGRSFGVSRTAPKTFNVLELGGLLEEVHGRLAGVIIEGKPFADVLRLYDGEDTLFYADPPYWGCESDYGKGMFARADFEQLAAVFADLRGRFILSLNDTPEVRRIFGAFRMAEARLKYQISGAATDAVEVIITNFDVAELAGGNGQGALF
jgi:DNA adenine methylase